jgi:hypothetical protein
MLGISQMDKNQAWYDGINKQISMRENQWHFLDKRKWKLPLIRRMSKRVDGFSRECEECQGIKHQLEELCRYLAHKQGIVRQEYKNYQSTIKRITHHLKQKHRLINEKQYVKRFVSTSFVLGLTLILFGYILLCFGNTLLALSITIPALFGRIIFSYAIGHLLDIRAKKQGRVI